MPPVPEIQEVVVQTYNAAEDSEAGSRTYDAGQGVIPQAGSTSGGVSFLRAFLNEEQDPAAVARVYERLTQICTAGESILYIAVQKSP